MLQMQPKWWGRTNCQHGLRRLWQGKVYQTTATWVQETWTCDAAVVFYLFMLTASKRHLSLVRRLRDMDRPNDNGLLLAVKVLLVVANGGRVTTRHGKGLACHTFRT